MISEGEVLSHKISVKRGLKLWNGNIEGTGRRINLQPQEGNIDLGAIEENIGFGPEVVT